MDGRIYGLLGRTLGHSWSPAIHEKLGNPAYQLMEREPDQLAEFLRHPNLGGVNVTIPYKQTVLPFCDHIDPLAAQIGSVNTIVNRGGELYAWNTDIIGFCFMAHRTGIDFAGKKVLIFGSGGTSHTARTGAEQMGAREVVVVSRNGKDNYSNISLHRDAEILVNTTPVGMVPNTGKSVVDLDDFPQCEGVLDVIYNPRRTAFLLQAEARGIRCSDGLPMLVAQAKAAVEHFFDRSIDDSKTEEIIADLRRETQNIVLIGMPGCGKSTVGAELEKLTGRTAVDLDTEIERQDGRTIPAIFREDGESFFRALEQAATADFGRRSGLILMTGGGVVTDKRNYPSLHQNGRIYQLTRNIEALPTEGRPLSQTNDLQTLYETRKPLYEQFRDVTVENNDTPQAAAAWIWRDFCAHIGDERPEPQPFGYPGTGDLRTKNI